MVIIMAEIFRNKKPVKSEKSDLVVFFLEILAGALVLMFASSLFENFYVENIWYALLASLVISIFNVSIKPILVFLTLPVTFASLGLLYPIVNLIILKLTGLVLGSSFVISGWILAFFIAIFISIMTLIFKKIVVALYKEAK